MSVHAYVLVTSTHKASALCSKLWERPLCKMIGYCFYRNHVSSHSINEFFCYFLFCFLPFYGKSILEPWWEDFALAARATAHTTYLFLQYLLDPHLIYMWSPLGDGQLLGAPSFTAQWVKFYLVHDRHLR